MKPLRWHAASPERTGAMIVISVCSILLATIIFWPSSAPVPKDVDKTVPFTAKPSIKAPQLSQPLKSTPQPKHRPASPPSIATQAVVKFKSSTVQSGYLVQVGAFKSKQRALKLKNRLAQKKWPVSIKLTAKHLYSVRVGPYKKQTSAQKTQLKLQRLEKIQGYITHH